MGFIKAATGVGITTKVAMESADLGIMRWDAQRGAIAAMYGDNFEWWRLQGEWLSPSIVMYDTDFNVLGIPTVSGIVSEGRRRQLWDYPHNNPDYSTILPCDFIRIGDFWYVAAMVTQGLGNEKRTIFWQSRNLVDWEKTNPYVSLVHRDDHGNFIGHPGNVMLTFDQIEEYVYIFGTNGLARDRAIWMWRCLATQFPQGPWEPWGHDPMQKGWDWGNPNENSPVLPGRYGELCFRYIQGNCVLSFFDVDNYSCSALTVVNPTDYWPGANRVDYANGQDYPQLYGGYISPDSELNKPDGMRFLISQWNTATNEPYHAVAVKNTLNAQGRITVPTPLPVEPVIVPTPTPEPLPTPGPPIPTPTPPPKPPFPEPAPLPDVPTDPQELYELLIKELAASGSTQIVTSDGRRLTLREAVGEIYEQMCSLHSLKGQPQHPYTPVPQLDHVLSGRFEGLYTQAVVVTIADHLGIDTKALYDQVKRSIG